jgi:hypothetical protein
MADGNAFLRINTSATFLLKSGPGNLHSCVINSLGVGSDVKLFDGLDNTGVPISRIDTTMSVGTFTYDVRFVTGLCVVTTGSTPANITVAYI